LTTTVKLPYKPRKAFVKFHQRVKRWALMVCHRRAGKTVACVNDLVVRGVYTKKKNARYAYVAPFRQQAKEIAWTYLKEATNDIRVEAPRESELRVKLPNDVWITLYGADNPDALRGLYFDGIILDEFGDMKPSLLGEVILPCLADRQGWLAIIGTAKGRNQFYDYHRKAKAEDVWYYKMLKASDSKIISDEELQNLKDVMTEDQYEQEMECNFDAALQGTYYADMINKIDKDGKLQYDERLYNPDQKVHVAADVGLRDSTAWWFWQPRPDGIAVIDYYEANGKHVDHYLEMLHNKGYEYHEIWLPHDAKAKTLATRRSTVEQFANPYDTVKITAPSLTEAYPPGSRLPIRIVPKLGVQHGIDAARQVLALCYFDMVNCEQGIDALRSYRRTWSELSKSFADNPYHDWASNGADGFRYLALVSHKSVGQLTEQPRVTELPDGVRMGKTYLPDGQGYTLDQLFEDRDDGNKRRGIIRI